MNLIQSLVPTTCITCAFASGSGVVIAELNDRAQVPTRTRNACDSPAPWFLFMDVLCKVW